MRRAVSYFFRVFWGRRAATSQIGAAVPKIGERSRPDFFEIERFSNYFFVYFVFSMYIRPLKISQESVEFFPALNFFGGEAHERIYFNNIINMNIYFSESPLGTELFY
jgi:hypothetical protein